MVNPLPAASVRNEIEVPPAEAKPEVKVEIQNLSFFYGRNQVLRNVSLDVPAYQVTAMIGPSGLRLQGMNKRRDLDERVEKALRESALWDEVKSRLHQLAHNLSGGQQQRLCIARAIATDPDVVLFDEPTSALDPIATSKIEELIVEMKKRVTVIIVTHNLQQAGRISDRTAFMYLGELIEFGETNRMFTNPAKPQTEDYISGRFG